MPTPSSNAPDSQTPRSYPFSTCPDPDDQSHQPESESQEQRPSQEPSSWHPHPPPPYSAYGESQQHSRMDEDVEISRSTTMSPRPQSSSTEDHDMDPEGMMAVEGDSEDSHKQADNDETIMNTDAAPVGGIAGAVAAESSSDIAGRRRPADHVRSRRKADQEPVSPVVTSVEELDGWELSGGAPRWIEDSGLVGMGYEYAQRRVIATSPSSYLRPGSRFSGTQQSERQRYDVQVEIKYVDMRESFLCGYLRIQGLTDDHPTLTTYFEGEIIGPKYGFVTQHPSWGSTEKIDFSHWNKFTAFRHIPKQDKKRGQIKDVAQRENIFMRWKEHFLVPDHKVKTINGASFEGFYYICFNQIKGEVSGIYFHSKSEKFQQLELKHVQDKGCFGAMEFR